MSLCYGTQKLFIQPRKSLENGLRQVIFTILATRFVHYPAKISLINRGIIYVAYRGNLTGDDGSYYLLEAVGKALRNAQSGE